MIDATQVKFAAYSRKSTEGEERQVLSLNDQKREIEDVVRKERLTVITDFLGDEKGESQSAHKRGRPIFGNVIEQIETGKANGLLVWHPNRIARNAYDGGLIITLMDEDKLLMIKTPGKTYFNTPEDKFMLQLEFGMAKKSSDDGSVAVKRGLKTKLNMGWFPGVAPLGYRNTILRDKGDNQIEKDPERFELVRQLWDWMLSGNMSVMEILRRADTELHLTAKPTRKHPGVNPLSRAGLYKLLTNPFYYGYFEYGGELHKGAHEPMISEEEFMRVQAVLGKKGRHRPKERQFDFTGLMRCGSCGAMITAEVKVKRYKNDTSKTYVYYHCTKRIDPNCTERSVELADFNEQVDRIISGLAISPKFQAWALKYLHEIRNSQAIVQDVSLAEKQRQHRAVVSQLENLVLRFTAPENAENRLLSESEYLIAKEGLLKRKGVIEGEMKAEGQSIEEWVELSERTFNFVRYARIWFKQGDRNTRRAIFSALGSHLVLTNQTVAIKLHPVFQTVADNLFNAEAEISLVRTLETSVNKGQIAQVWAGCPSLRRRWDSNPRGLSAWRFSRPLVSTTHALLRTLRRG